MAEDALFACPHCIVGKPSAESISAHVREGKCKLQAVDGCFNAAQATNVIALLT